MPKMSESDSQIMKEKLKFYLKWFFGSFIWLGVLVLIIDLVSKLVVVANKDYITSQGGVVLINNFLRINYVINSNFVFGIGKNNPDSYQATRIAFCVVALVIVVGIIFYLVKKWGKTGKMIKACLMMIIAGALGNVIDRVFYTPQFLGNPYNGVVDWIDFYGVWKFNFNIADSAVVIAAILLIVYMIVVDIIAYRKDTKDKPKKVKESNEKVLSKTEREKNEFIEKKDD